MLLSILYKEYDLAIEKILIREHKRLKLSFDELGILIVLLESYNKKRNFSVLFLTKKTEFSKDKVGVLVDSLIEKGLMKLELEKVKDGKEREVVILEPMFEKIEDLLLSDEENKNLFDASNEVNKTVSSLEELFKRSLTDYELEQVRVWFENKVYSYPNIKEAIIEAGNSGKTSIKVIERILKIKSSVTEQTIDANKEQILNDIFKSIK